MAPNYSISDVRDVASAHITAMENPHITGRFCLCSPAMHLAEILQVVHENFLDVHIPTKKLLGMTIE
jgi:hypothetical protein